MFYVDFPISYRHTAIISFFTLALLLELSRFFLSVPYRNIVKRISFVLRICIQFTIEIRIQDSVNKDGVFADIKNYGIVVVLHIFFTPTATKQQGKAKKKQNLIPVYHRHFINL